MHTVHAACICFGIVCRIQESVNHLSMDLAVAQRLSRVQLCVRPMHLMLEMAFVKVLGSLSQSKVNVRPEDNTTE